LREVRSFGTSTSELQSLADWLSSKGCTHVAMESTGVYWKPVSHDEWTRKKFDEGKYKSSEIYGTPKDPELKKEYDEYLEKRLEEIRKKTPQ
jgi:hypothetical protein